MHGSLDAVPLNKRNVSLVSLFEGVALAASQCATYLHARHTPRPRIR